LMTERVDRMKVAVLRALEDIDGPAGAARILQHLQGSGVALKPRTIRLYLQKLDDEGMTTCVSRRLGRQITERGREELAHSNVLEKVGFVASKVDALGYRMSFNCQTGVGSIIANVTMIDERVLGMALKEMAGVFAAGLGMGGRLIVAEEGSAIGPLTVPPGRVGIGTVCSVTVNGILLHEGIPVTSRFGGLLEIREGKAVRFIELIEYSGTTLDPLEAFIRAGMTDVSECAETGNGIIGASFREIPSAAIEDALRVQKAMQRKGLGGIMAVGQPNKPLFDIPVADGRAGLIVIGGLNPVAAVHESGIRISMYPLTGLENYESFTDYKELCTRYGG